MTLSTAKRSLFVLAFSFYSLLSSSSILAATSVTTYDQLLKAIRETRHATESRIEQAVEQEKVREAWEIGKLIDEHVLRQKRADYGKHVLLRLSKDLGMSATELGYMLQFARTYPVYRTTHKLSWGHYESLLALNTAEEREEVEALASKEDWPVKRLREEVRKRKAAKNESGAGAGFPSTGSGSRSESREKSSPALESKPGKVGTYKIVKATVGREAGKLVIGLGFSNYYKTSRDLRFKEGDIIESIPALKAGISAPSDKIKFSKRAAQDLYTYHADVFEIIDGDTIKAVIDLGFGVRTVQTLRLRGLDAPEIISAEGKEAKAFLEKMVMQSAKRIAHGETDQNSNSSRSALSAMRYASSPVLIKTIKSDKYDRYLADLFVDGQYINAKLVNEGYATLMNE